MGGFVSGGSRPQVPPMATPSGGGSSSAEALDAETNEQGRYSIEVDSDHEEEEECEVVLVSSPDEDCNQISHELHQQIGARISLTQHNGIAGPVRIPNPLGFMKKEPAPECPQVLKELGLTPDGNVA
ncbi:hypothetical protein ACLB2K_025071 [Fragaria x ananassa]